MYRLLGKVRSTATCLIDAVTSRIHKLGAAVQVMQLGALLRELLQQGIPTSSEGYNGVVLDLRGAYITHLETMDLIPSQHNKAVLEHGYKDTYRQRSSSSAGADTITNVMVLLCKSERLGDESPGTARSEARWGR